MPSRLVPALLLLAPLLAPAGSASDFPILPVDPNDTCLDLHLQGQEKDLQLAGDGCSENPNAITFDGLVREGEAKARVLFQMTTLMFYASARVAAPVVNTSMVVRVTAHASWQAGCFDPEGTYSVQYNDGTPQEGMQSVALAKLCHDTSPEAVRAVLLDLAADLTRDAPQAGDIARTLVEGLPRPPEAPPQPDVPGMPEVPVPTAPGAPTVTPAEDPEHVGVDTDTILKLSAEERTADLDSDTALEAGGYRVETAAPAPSAAHARHLRMEGVARAPFSAPAPSPSTARAHPAAPAPQPPLAEPHATTAAPSPHVQPPARTTTMTATHPLLRAPPPTAVVLAAGAAAALLALAVALYQRLGRHAALAHPKRTALHRAAIALGAGTARALAAAAGVDRRSADYHLRYLVRAGLLHAHARPDAPTLYAIPGAARPATPEEPLAARLLSSLRGQPGQSASELAQAAGVGYGRADRRLKDLLRAGTVESRVAEGERRYYTPGT